MFLIKNLLVLSLGIIQMIIGGVWFGALISDFSGQSGNSITPRVDGSIHFLFGLVLLLGGINIYLGITNVLHGVFHINKKFPTSFSIALLTLIATVFLMLAIRSVLAMTSVPAF